MTAFIDWSSFVSLLILAAAVVVQMARIHARKSSGDISYATIVLRLIAMSMLFVKFYAIKEWHLVCGQIVLLVVYSIYACMVVHYRKREKITE